MTIYDYNSTIMIDTLPIKSHTTTMDDSVTVDTTQTEIGQPVTTSTIEIGSIELEDTA